MNFSKQTMNIDMTGSENTVQAGPSSITVFPRSTNLKDFVPGHVIGSDSSVSFDRKELCNWLKINWETRFTTWLNVHYSESKRNELCVMKEVQYNPIVTSNYEGLIHVDLLAIENMKKVRVNLPIKFVNASSLKFGITVLIKKTLKVLQDLNSWLSEVVIDLPKYMSVNHRVVRIEDIRLEGCKILENSRTVICRSLKSAQERQSVHKRWLEERKKRASEKVLA